jgi:hypothetical protein
MTANLHFLAEHGQIHILIALAGFKTVGDVIFDQRLAALKAHCEERLTAYGAITLLDDQSAILREATQAGRQDAFVAHLAIMVMQGWVGQLEDAIRERVAT